MPGGTMTEQAERRKPKDGMEALELAALRNAPLSVGRPETIGREPMARGRFLVPKDGVLVLENLQVPGRNVDISIGSIIEAFFQSEGDLYTFRSRVLAMDTPVRLNDTLVVKGMQVSAPKTVDKGNRRRIYRQSFAVADAPVDVELWAVPQSMLTPQQIAQLNPGEGGGRRPTNRAKERTRRAGSSSPAPIPRTSPRPPWPPRPRTSSARPSRI